MPKKLLTITKRAYPLLVVLVVFASFATASEQNQRKKILVLFSFRSTMPVAKQWENGIRAIFESDQSSEYIINIEHLDLLNYQEPQYTKLLFDLYRYKYTKPEPQLIIPIHNASVDLVFKHRKNFLPDVPIVFGGVDKQFIENKKIPSNTTGYLTEINYKETLNLALKLHPETENIVIVGGVGRTLDRWINSLRLEYEDYEDTYSLSYLIGLPMPLLLDKVRILPHNSIIISLPIFIDGAGKEFVGNESLRMITKAATAPVYTFWNSTLGTGVVGGHMSSFKREGREVARLGLQILNGQKPSDIPITQVLKSDFMFDWRQLKRWSISQAQLPADSIVLFEEFTLWDKYKKQFLFLFGLFVLLILIISFLLLQRRVLVQAKEKLLVAEQKYKTVSDHTYDWEYWLDADNSMRYVSPSCKRISDYSAEEFIANPSLLHEIIMLEDKKIWEGHICGKYKKETPEIIRFRIKRADDQIRWIEHVCQPVFDLQGNNQGVRASNRDTTEREYYKSKTAQLQSELAHMDRVVTISALTAAFAHEINQPLAAMRSYAQAAIRFIRSEKPDYENTEKALQGIVADNKRAASVVNKLRGLVKKEKTQLDLISINSVINDVLTLMNSETVLRNTTVRLQLQSEVTVVLGDVIQIQQVLINLLTNALDAMDTQPVDARVITISTRPESKSRAVISISDSGNGVPVEKMESIFEPFQTTKREGIGIGLSICKSIIQAHGGEISVRNNQTAGATFSFILPTTNRNLKENKAQ